MQNTIIFATKRGGSYNYRKYLIVDLDNREYATEPRKAWYTREEMIEVTNTDRHKLIDAFKAQGYKAVENL